MAKLHHVLSLAVSSRYLYWFLGLLLITLPSFVLGREFSHVWERMSRDRAKEDIGLDPHPEDPLYSPVYSARRPDPPPRFSLPPPTPRTPSRDLSNMKLAQNQTELSRQIENLAATVEIQGRMLQRLMEVLEENTRKMS